VDEKAGESIAPRERGDDLPVSSVDPHQNDGTVGEGAQNNVFVLELDPAGRQEAMKDGELSVKPADVFEVAKRHVASLFLIPRRLQAAQIGQGAVEHLGIEPWNDEQGSHAANLRHKSRRQQTIEVEECPLKQIEGKIAKPVPAPQTTRFPALPKIAQRRSLCDAHAALQREVVDLAPSIGVA
jgi:hypothetical protein